MGEKNGKDDQTSLDGYSSVEKEQNENADNIMTSLDGYLIPGSEKNGDLITSFDGYLLPADAQANVNTDKLEVSTTLLPTTPKGSIYVEGDDNPTPSDSPIYSEPQEPPETPQSPIYAEPWEITLEKTQYENVSSAETSIAETSYVNQVNIVIKS